MKSPRIRCVMEYDSGKEQAYQDFYLNFEGRDYFLFRQEYRRGIKEYFGYEGVELSKALKNNWNKNNQAILRTIDKIPTYIKYVEKEYGIAVLNRTKRRI